MPKNRRRPKLHPDLTGEAYDIPDALAVEGRGRGKQGQRAGGEEAKWRRFVLLVSFIRRDRQTDRQTDRHAQVHY